HPLILVDDVAPSKLHPCLYLVTLGEEFTGMPCLEVEVVLVGVRSKPNLLELHRLRLLPGFLFLLLLLVSVFAVVDDLNDRGLSHWGDLDQIQPEFASAPERLIDIHHIMGAVGLNDSNLGGPNFFVYACLVCDRSFGFS